MKSNNKKKQEDRSRDVYKFRVGVRNLRAGSSGTPGILGSSGAKHAAFLINRDLFEYDQNGWKRHKDRGRDPDYDWDKIGNALNGTTYVSPDELQAAIDKSGDWRGNYNLRKHNCQDFAQFCLKEVGCSESMASKRGSVYREQKEGACVIF